MRALRNFDLEPMMGNWYVVQYYASTEELPEYACMRSHFTFTSDDQHVSGYVDYQVLKVYRPLTFGIKLYCIEALNGNAKSPLSPRVYSLLYPTYLWVRAICLLCLNLLQIGLNDVCLSIFPPFKSSFNVTHDTYFYPVEPVLYVG